VPAEGRRGGAAAGARGALCPRPRCVYAAPRHGRERANSDAFGTTGGLPRRWDGSAPLPVSNAALAVALVAFVVLMFGIGLRAQARIRTLEDYLVAGRKLSWPLASATLFATWFGAGTLLTATDETRAEGLRAAALEPIGPGICLVLAGLFFEIGRAACRERGEVLGV